MNKTAKWGLINAQEIEEAMKKGVDVSAEDVERTRHRRFLYEKHPRIGRLVSFVFSWFVSIHSCFSAANRLQDTIGS